MVLELIPNCRKEQRVSSWLIGVLLTVILVISCVIWNSLGKLWNCILHGADVNEEWSSDYNNQPVCGALGRQRVMQHR